MGPGGFGKEWQDFLIHGKLFSRLGILISLGWTLTFFQMDGLIFAEVFTRLPRWTHNFSHDGIGW